MLISIVLVLTSKTDAEVAAATGRANYAAALRALGTIDPALAERTHGGDGPKAITCSAILEGKARRDLMPIYRDKPYTVRLTGLTGEVSRGLEMVLLDSRPKQWELSSHKFDVAGVICDPTRHPWTGRTTYEELAAANLIRREPEPQVTLEFATPTAFKSAGMTMPMPLPNLVFGSLVERWNAFSTVPLDPEMRQFGGEGIAVSRYRMESLAMDQKGTAFRIGGIGQTTYRAMVSDRYFHCVMQMLGHFALYSGIGVQTATGMGQARRLEWEKRDRPNGDRNAHGANKRTGTRVYDPDPADEQ
jgi:CRISPR-associated endoribonuclease Cas6